MQIKRLRIAGFKSFVDPVDLPVAPGLTGVVGPNGCGKSNLLEALRWTMGETSARSLRGGGMEDVIFAGTATRPPRDFAEVSLLTEVPGPDGAVEREVTRRIERGAGSAYRVDGQDVRARDVQLLFADAATGAHSPAMVSQGRIGAVIAAKPAERRAMLEEAAGIAGLHVRRREAELRLGAAAANLERLDALIADQSQRAGQLRRQARAAERYRDLSERIRTAEARLIYARWREAAAAAEAAAAEAAGMEAQVAAATAREAEAARRQAGAIAAVVEARARALGARDRAGEAAQALADRRRDLADVERQLRELDAAARRLADERGRETDLAREAAQAIEALAEDRARLEAELAEQTASAPALEAALAEAERRARDAEVRLAQAQARAASEAADARVAAAALAQARARHDRVVRDAAQLAELAAGLGAAEPLAAARDAAAVRRIEAVAASDAARRTGEAAEAAEREAAAARDLAAAARASARAELAALDAEIAALAKATARGGGDRLIDHLSARPGFERAVAAALDEALESALAAWTGAAPQTGDPPPPPATVPLAGGVDAPPALARRLAQVFVAETDEGQPLAVGQRLVTRAGALRRWDGFRAEGGGAAAAERLERLNRLALLRDARPAALAAAEATEAEHDRAETAIAAARRAVSEARGALARAEVDARDAAREEDRAAAALERLTAQRADLDARAARIAAERDEAEAERDRAAAALATLPDGREAQAAAAELAATAEAARTAVAEARAARLTLETRTGQLRERLAGVAADARGWRARAGEAARRVAEADQREAEVAAAQATLTGRPEALAEAIARAEAEHQALRGQADAAQRAEAEAEAAARQADAAHRAAAGELATLREARAGVAARAEAQELRRVEMGRVAGERFACPAVLLPERQGFDKADVADPAAESARHDRLTAERERLGPVNLVAEQELAGLEASGAANAAERAELGEAIARLRGSIGALNREGRQRLLAAFEAVDGHFRRLFTTLFDGGQAHLQLIEADDPLEAGLEIMAQPPGKRLQSLTLLSGGEQALTAVALIFALFLTNPAPICVLDEVDAPLDDANIERFCDLLDRMAAETDTRYLIVTHNAVTMSRMHRLFGVTMIERGVSRLVSVDLGGAERLLAAE
jgi:chromosome segregation protein